MSLSSIHSAISIVNSGHFSDESFRPDMLKIYPCMVMPGTELEKEFKEGKFVPIKTEEAALHFSSSLFQWFGSFQLYL